METKAEKQARQTKAATRLRALLPRGAAIYVASDGAGHLKFYAVEDLRETTRGEIIIANITKLAALVAGLRYNAASDTIGMGGSGYCKAQAAVDTLAQSLHGDTGALRYSVL